VREKASTRSKCAGEKVSSRSMLSSDILLVQSKGRASEGPKRASLVFF
jgi:hypothetical protein